jgi:hypothetical protein
MRIYITHCCAKKSLDLKGIGKLVTPDHLYIASPTRRFIKKCKDMNVKWAIFSDLYDVWFSDEKHEWYEKNPNNVNEREFIRLLNNFDYKLKDYDEIWFYYNPGRFHKLYKQLIHNSTIKCKIKLFSHLNEIQKEI